MQSLMYVTSRRSRGRRNLRHKRYQTLSHDYSRAALSIHQLMRKVPILSQEPFQKEGAWRMRPLACRHPIGKNNLTNDVQYRIG